MDELGNSLMVSDFETVECSMDEGSLYCLVQIMVPMKFGCQVIKVDLLGCCIKKSSLQTLCDTLIVNEQMGISGI